MSARTWLITGCSRGFGRTLAELLLTRGERVVATARRADSLDTLVASHAEHALACKLDVTRTEDVQSAVAAARSRFGPIDVLINNAGYGHIGTVEDLPIEAARTLLETNLLGALAMIKEVLPEMRRSRAGQIVNIGSVAGQIGFPALGFYCASKFALAGLTQSLAAEVAPLGIKVTLAELGPFATEFTRSMTVMPPSTPDYDLAALARVAGNSGWGTGDDPYLGAAALLAALADPTPPVHLILGQPGLDIVARHEAIRHAERERWLGTAKLQVATAPRAK
jgi:NAD(P)-dependent dehydrogenase (short-subunit alcohol dehydrogenase family)